MEGRSHRRELRDGARLAMVPAAVALVLGLLVAPRAPDPEGVPVPLPDGRALARAAADDDARAAAVRDHPLPGPVRALGSALREFHTLEAGRAEGGTMAAARERIDAALSDVLSGGGDPVGALVSLRAIQLHGFLDEVRRFEATGQESAELRALAGDFVRAMQADGWGDGRVLAATEPALRVMYKEMWRHVVGLDAPAARPGARRVAYDGLKPTLDEERVLYAFYLSHPHPSKGMREALAAARRGARDERACLAIGQAERVARASWQLERVTALAEVDAAYPVDYARGVLTYTTGDYTASVRAFQRWVDAHPDGPYALRARGYLRAAARAAEAAP